MEYVIFFFQKIELVIDGKLKRKKKGNNEGSIYGGAFGEEDFGRSILLVWG